MNLKTISLVKNKFKSFLKSKEILDLFVFGSVLKGKLVPKDIDVAILFYDKPTKEIKDKLNKINNFHISIITVKEFFINPPSLANTLLREGYSIRNKKVLSELFSFSSRVLFKYELVALTPSTKVKIVNILRGRKEEKGLVERTGGEWIANQVFVAPLSADKLFEELFNNFKLKFNKNYLLMH